MAKYVELPSGYKMPTVGLGTWQATNEQELETALNEALKCGYRHIDTAYLYENEKIIGKVLKEWLNSGRVKREELFIVTKLPGIGVDPGKVSHFLNMSLVALQLDYVDLYLIHGPIGMEYVNDTELWPTKDGLPRFNMKTDLEGTWKAMEKEVDAGRCRSIGISNFDENQVERMVKIARIPVSNIQVELQVYMQQHPLREVCRKHKISVCAYGPFGSPGRRELFAKRGMPFEDPGLLDDPQVKSVAEKLGKTTAQILLRFLLQEGIIVIPKSTNPQRLRANFELFDFELSAEDMQKLKALDKGEDGRFFSFTAFKGIENHPECPAYIKKRLQK